MLVSTPIDPCFHRMAGDDDVVLADASFSPCGHPDLLLVVRLSYD